MSISDWTDLMPHTVGYRAVATRDEYGKPATYSAAVDYQARVRYKQQRITSFVTGQDEIAVGEIWLAGTLTTIRADDELTLPDGTHPPIVAWDTVPDEAGDHHTKIWFGAT